MAELIQIELLQRQILKHVRYLFEMLLHHLFLRLVLDCGHDVGEGRKLVEVAEFDAELESFLDL